MVDKTTASGAVLVGIVMIVVGIALYSITAREPDVVILGDVYYRIVHPYENPSRVLIIAGILFVVGGVLIYPFRLRLRAPSHDHPEEHEEPANMVFCSKCGSKNDRDAVYSRNVEMYYSRSNRTNRNSEAGSEHAQTINLKRHKRRFVE